MSIKKLSLTDRAAFEIVGIINDVESHTIEVISNNEVYTLTVNRDSDLDQKNIKKGDRIFAKGEIKSKQVLEVLHTVIFDIHTGGILYVLD